MGQQKRPVAAFDIDGTLFRSGLYREVFYELHKMDKVPRDLAAKTTTKHRQWRHRVHGNAFEEFDMMIVDVLDNYIANIKIADYNAAVQRVIEKKAENVYVYTRRLLQKLQAQGYFTVAISGSQMEIVEPFAQLYKFDDWLGARWDHDENEEYFTKVATKTHSHKDQLLSEMIKKHNLTLEGSVAVGDSKGDIGMLEMVDRPIVFNPTKQLIDEAISRGWKVVIERKNVSYELLSTNEQHYLSLVNHY